MRKFFRIFLLIIASVSVGALSYAAYSLNTRTLTFPFIGGESQKGGYLEFVVSPPSFVTPSRDALLIDQEAIMQSLERNGTPLSRDTVSSEYAITVQGGYVNISPRNPNTDKAPLILKSSLYNKITSAPFRLPRNITFTLSDIPKALYISASSEPKNQTYNVSFFGLNEGLTPKDIHYYVHYDPDAQCHVSNWESFESLRPTPPNFSKYGQTPVVSGETFVRKDRIEYSPIAAEEVIPEAKDGFTWQSRVHIPYNIEASRVCIIAGVGGVYQVVEDRFIEPFSATGGLLQALSPEYDMKSQIEFTFSHDIYTDSGALYSTEYINHRNDVKLEFLKHLDITPNISIKPDDLMLTPDRAVLTLPLDEGKDYNISLRDISDIYGRKSSVHMFIKPVSEPFLSLKFENKKQIYTMKDTIEAKLYALKAPKNTYSLKLCSLNIEEYSQIERMLTNTNRGKNTLVSQILDHGKECRTKDIVLNTSGYVSRFHIDDFFLTGKKPGLYVLYFSNPSDTASFEKFIPPLLFSLVDTHLVLKVDASGKMMVLATDILTGKPRENQSVSVLRNISRTHKERWDSTNQRVEKEYIPLTSQAFATGISIGKTNILGMVESKVDTLPGVDGYDMNPYSLTFQSWWDYEGRYDSFLVESRGDGHLGYLVSTWNDGITGYNFGIKEYDYSYLTRGKYTSYIHPDRKLYLPGEKVHIHAIIRENKAALSIPSATPFNVTFSDPLGREIKTITIKPNEFGSFSLDYDLPKDAQLGMYSVSITTSDQTEFIENAWTNFQVEVFKNPTFTATVELKSDGLQDGSVKNLSKHTNDDAYNPWYKDVYTGNFAIGGVVQAKYYNGAEIKNTPFTYRVYRSEYYPDDYWGDCFWGCYWEPPLELYTEGSGSIDADGYGILRIPVEYKSFYSDYKYTVEVTIRDPLTGEEVTTPGSLVVKLPNVYKGFSTNNPLIFTPKKKILKSTEILAGEFAPTYGKWDTSLSGKYVYEILRREYDEGWVEDIRAGKTRITTSNDIFVASGVIMKKDFSEHLPVVKSGEYHIKVHPVETDAPDTSNSESIFYIAGDFTSLKDSELRVIPEKTVYKAGETARVMFQVPFTGAYLLITEEKGGIQNKEYIYLTGNTITKEYKIDDTKMPNSYIGGVALKAGAIGGETKSYAVGYGEIVTDISEKKSLLTITPDKDRYKNKENVNVDLTLTDFAGNPIVGEVTVMVVDESLIRLLGNIDLDILPKFYQKFPFTVHTALTAIGIERGQFLSRKGSNGGGGSKGGDGVEIATRTIFENTAYYHPGIVTDLSGKAKISFTLPDNITNYRIIAIANTKNSQFSVKERTIEVRKDYVLESKLPMILRNGDTFTAIVSAYNGTKKITNADIIFAIGTGSGKIEKKSSITLDVEERKKAEFLIQVPESWIGNVPYTIELRENKKVLDALSSTLRVAPLPILTDTPRDVRSFTGTTFTYNLLSPTLKDIDLSFSTVQITLSNSYASEWKSGLDSLIAYPYGCIEQTIASTLPNRIALSLTGIITGNFDTEKARNNVATGLAKILRMQHISGGWTYWEGDNVVEPHITPYVVRSLLLFRSLGEIIPNDALTNGVNYIVANEAEYEKSMDLYAEATWTLALMKDPNALTWWNKIDTKKLTRHGYLAYIYAAQKLGTYSLESEKTFIQLLNTDTAYNWYWTSRADRAIFVQLLFERNDRDKALGYLEPLMHTANIDSYFVSTQEKIQLLLALLSETKDIKKLKSPESVALRGDTIITDISLKPEKLTNTVETSREKIGQSYNLKRSYTASPFIVTTRIQDAPKDITRLPAYSTGGMNITRQIDLIDDAKGVDKDNNFLSATPVKDMVFKKGKLYRVTLTATLKDLGSDMYWYNLAIEDYFPAAWRPINQKFQTESSLLSNVEDENWWSYSEAKDDRILAHIGYGWGTKRTFTYYFRPELPGDYLLPPASAYYMYDPDVHAYTQFGRVKVEQ